MDTWTTLARTVAQRISALSGRCEQQLTGTRARAWVGRSAAAVGAVRSLRMPLPFTMRNGSSCVGLLCAAASRFRLRSDGQLAGSLGTSSVSASHAWRLRSAFSHSIRNARLQPAVAFSARTARECPLDEYDNNSGQASGQHYPLPTSPCYPLPVATHYPLPPTTPCYPL
jgi:hypothetical protein